jgi:hypothetical protein
MDVAPLFSPFVQQFELKLRYQSLRSTEPGLEADFAVSRFRNRDSVPSALQNSQLHIRRLRRALARNVRTTGELD